MSNHPLTPDLSKVNIEDLNKKYGDLLKRITYAYRIGQSQMVGQLQLLMQDYQDEISNRNQQALADMEKNSKNFKNIIDIQ
jgi:hypothetical protein